MISLDRSLADLVRRGVVSPQDAMAYAKNRDYFKMLVGRTDMHE